MCNLSNEINKPLFNIEELDVDKAYVDTTLHLVGVNAKTYAGLEINLLMYTHDILRLARLIEGEYWADEINKLSSNGDQEG